MKDFFVGHLDYLYFVCVLGFLLMATVAFILSKTERDRVTWRWLALFGVLAGLNELIDLCFLSMPAIVSTVWFAVVRVCFLTGTYCCLLELYRRNHPSWHHVSVLFIVYGILGGSGIALGVWQGIEFVTVYVRWVLGCGGSFLAASVFMMRAQERYRSPSDRLILWTMTGALGFLGLTQLVVARAAFFPVSVYNEETFLSVCQFPIQFIRALLAIIMAYSVWLYAITLRASVVTRRTLYRDVWPVAGVLLVLASGWFVTEQIRKAADADERNTMIALASVVAASIDINDVRALSGTPADSSRREYQRIYDILMRTGSRIPGITTSYLMGMSEGNVFFYVDAEQGDDPSVAIGLYYDEASPELKRLFTNGIPLVEGPLADRWGIWISPLVPLRDPASGAVVAVYGFDCDAQTWNRIIYHHRLLPMVICLLIIVIGLVLFALWHYNEDQRMADHAQLDRIRRQQDAIMKIALMPSELAGDIRSTEHLLTESVAEALEVERVGIWLGGNESGELRCADLFERSRARHSSGTVLRKTDYPPYFDALTHERIMAVSVVGDDARTRSLAHGYCDQQGITSKLDASIFVSGKQVGVLSFEGTGPARIWQPDEMRFAGEAADQVAQMLLNANRIQIDRMLNEQSRLLQTIFDGIPDIINVQQRDHTIVAYNKTAYAFLKKMSPGTMGKKCYEMFGRTKECEVCSSVHAYEHGGLAVVEKYVAEIDQWVESRAMPVCNEKGDIEFVVEQVRDITARKRVDEMIKESERKYRDLFNQMATGLATHAVVCDANGTPIDYRFLSVNPAFEKLTGLHAQDIIGKTVKEVLPDLDDEWIKRYGKVALTGEPVEFEQYSAPLKRYYSVRAFSPEHGIFATLFYDVSARVNAEKLVQESQRYLAEIINAVNDPIFVKDASHTFVLVNDAFCSFLGPKKEDVIGKNDHDFFPKEQVAVFWEKDDLVLASGHDCVNEEMITAADGELRTIVTKKTVYTDPEGKKYIVGVIRDITDYKRVEQQLTTKLSELERVNRFMVNREMKMIELKQRIKQLEQGLE